MWKSTETKIETKRLESDYYIWEIILSTLFIALPIVSFIALISIVSFYKSLYENCLLSYVTVNFPFIAFIILSVVQFQLIIVAFYCNEQAW